MSQEFKNIVRISGKNLDGDRKLINAISNLKGIGDNLSYIILKSLNLNTNLRIGSVSDKEISLIESKLKIIHELDFPKWILNRRKDMDTGQDKHYVGSDLDFNIKLLLDSEKIWVVDVDLDICMVLRLEDKELELLVGKVEK